MGKDDKPNSGIPVLQQKAFLAAKITTNVTNNIHTTNNSPAPIASAPTTSRNTLPTIPAPSGSSIKRAEQRMYLSELCDDVHDLNLPVDIRMELLESLQKVKKYLIKDGPSFSPKVTSFMSLHSQKEN